MLTREPSYTEREQAARPRTAGSCRWQPIDARFTFMEGYEFLV
jgi:hypothetical protein